MDKLSLDFISSFTFRNYLSLLDIRARRSSRRCYGHQMCCSICRYLPGQHGKITYHKEKKDKKKKQKKGTLQLSNFNFFLLQKIYFSSYVELFVTLMALAVGMWWLFDRSQPGLVFSILTALVLSSLTHFMYILRYVCL